MKTKKTSLKKSSRSSVQSTSRKAMKAPAKAGTSKRGSQGGFFIHSVLDRAILVQTAGEENTAQSKSTKKSSLSGLANYSKAVVHVLPEGDLENYANLVKEYVPAWMLGKTIKDVYQVPTDDGLVVLICRRERPKKVSHGGLLEDANYAWYREQLGTVWTAAKNHNFEALEIYFHELDQECLVGALIGLELSSYQFKGANFVETDKWLKEASYAFSKEKYQQSLLPQLVLIGASADLVKSASNQAKAINLARHLVNLPPNEMVPESFANFAKAIFQKSANMKVEIWEGARLEKENMNLLLAVGKGSVHKPRFLHLSYRPKGATRKPIAFVGKGITFDTGGLDIKPSSGMRLMKKDMGGAAAVLGLAYWVSASHYPYPLDFYVALAENGVDGNAMRPSDIYISRGGHKVEIHNTDAEGRLVLCDTLDVAATQKGKDEPEIIIDLATLTGAIKVALGADIAGLFSNDDALAEALHQAGYEAGDLNWRMPLYGKYFSSMNSPFADFVNASDGFGGAITAALYLEKFIKGKQWAHLDIYAWNDRPSGSLSTSGGSGQPVQALIRYLETRV